MKKSVLIFCALLTMFSITAYGYLNWGNTVAVDHKKMSCAKTEFSNVSLAELINKKTDPPLFYNVDTRFIHKVSKEDLDKAKSIIDILPEKATKSIELYQDVKVAVIGDENEAIEMGNDHLLNTAQIKLLQSTEYSSNIYIHAHYKSKNFITGHLINDYLVYYMTVTPEKEAEFADGHNALIEYLRENSKEEIAIIQQDQLRPGTVNFTVTKNGTIADVKLASTSGYPSVDEALVEMIANMPQKWSPATNSKGETVDQELVFFFGKEGC